MSEAAVARAYGGPEVLSVIDVAVAEPGPGRVRIEVRAAGVNPFDHKMYSGAFGTDPANLPMRLGAEAAGVVTAVGADATGPAGPIQIGDEVIAYRAPGAYAAELIVPASLFCTRLGGTVIVLGTPTDQGSRLELDALALIGRQVKIASVRSCPDTPSRLPNGGLDLVRGRCRARGRRVSGRGQPRNRTR
jgi:NADPH:quinone reductase-like Zn-dependent oxidoreductase